MLMMEDASFHKRVDMAVQQRSACGSEQPHAEMLARFLVPASPAGSQ
jgi:hypothetical protein